MMRCDASKHHGIVPSLPDIIDRCGFPLTNAYIALYMLYNMKPVISFYYQLVQPIIYLFAIDAHLVHRFVTPFSLMAEPIICSAFYLDMRQM